MSLWSQLLKTYETLKNKPDVNDLSNVSNFLLKDGLLLNNMDIEIYIDDNAQLIDARLIPKEDKPTIIPATIESIGRTSGAAAHPLFDKLDYLVNDWGDYITDEKFIKDHTHKHYLYLTNLEKWANYSQNRQIKLVFEFFKNNKVLGAILNKLKFPELSNETEDIEINNKNTEESYKKLTEYMVRFIVGNELPNEMWKNQALYDEWSSHYLEIMGGEIPKEEISILNGEREVLQSYFPKKIRNSADGAKLISANDTSIFTFGGRFNPRDCNQAVALGQKSMQKALFTLSWLLKNQAYMYDNLTILSWSTKNINELNAFSFDYKDYINDDNFFAQVDNVSKDEFNSKSNKVISAIAHFGQFSKNLKQLTEENLVNIVILDGDDKGRISICYYNEIESSQYYKNLNNWFENTQWLYNKNGEKILKTPLFYEIFEICYPKSKPDKKMRKQFLKQILPSVIEGKKLSSILVKNAFFAIRQPDSFSSSGMWWNGICTTCALINNYRNFGGKYMALDKENTNRSYLFGRLLAVAENIEYTATRDERSNVSTNAERLFTQFTMRPAKTWCILEKQLQPYYDKLYKQGKGGLVQYFKNIIKEILDKMSVEDFETNKALDEMFVLGYYGQRNSYKETQNNEENEGEE